MKISYAWLQEYFASPLPSPHKVKEALTMHSFDFESTGEVDGDVIFDIKVLTDRGHDCLSHAGVAKEISVLFGLPLKKDPFLRDSGEYTSSKELTVTINTPLSHRYTGALIKGVTVAPSPDWLVKKLHAVGQKSINNIVDATNYVMFSLGQPLHAFDFKKLEYKQGVAIAVDVALGGEKIEALDKVVYTLPKETLLITDSNSKKILGVAGIKGGREAEITPETKDIILESANFDPVAVRKASQALRLHTDASTRFEKGLSPELSIHALEEAIRLIVSLAGGDIEGIADVYPVKQTVYKVGISKKEAQDILGITLSNHDIEKTITRLGFSFEKVAPRKKIVSDAKKYPDVPYKWGASVSREAPLFFDCSGFLTFLYREAGVFIPRISVDQYVYGNPIKERELLPGDAIYANSGVEPIHWESKEFMKGTKVPEGVDHVGLYLGEGKVIHATKAKGKVVIEDLKTSESFAHTVGFRRFLLDDSERYVITPPYYRLDISVKEDVAEEIGRVYGYEKIKSEEPPKGKKPLVNGFFYYTEEIRSTLVSLGFSEVYTYTLTHEGDTEIENPIAQDKRFLRTALSYGVGRALEMNTYNADLLGLDAVQIFEIGKVFTEKGERLQLAIAVKSLNKKISDEKLLSNALDALYKALGKNIAHHGKTIMTIFEADLDSLLSSLPTPASYRKVSISKASKYKTLSVYPFMLRDIALFVTSGTVVDKVLSIIEREAGDLLVKTRLFDVFEKKFEDGTMKTSYAFRLVFQSQEKTLSDEEVNVIMDKITKALNSISGWKVR